MKTNLRGFTSMTLLALAGLIAGCGGDDDTTGSGGAGGTGGSGGSGGVGGGDAAEAKIATSMGDWNIYRDPYADGGASPIMTVQGGAEAFSLGGGKMRIKLSVSGLPATRPFGSHVHKLACEDNKAGTHYQHNPAPDGGATDPMYANAMNEVWLDFTTDASGAATKETTVDFIPRTGEAKSVVIHDQLTMTGGLAGAKLACINMNF